MWTYENAIETTATAETVWQHWADVERWGDWNTDIEAIRIDGPFADGSLITMTPGGQDPVELRLRDVAENRHFIDEAEFAGLLFRTTHRLTPLADGRTQVLYRLEITGPGVEQAGPQIGPAISGDWPETMANLVKLAEQARA
ncbi:SRPBCC family protein [Kitasatospora sp. LaBMicrA B282]|uniref:SRPBCC family protein n=1 Tax=Kitasatospora sp. LaBMicrA B282 TaxID=3420949 RepID=UPI003D10C0CD